jgi:hypothetical protein
LKLGANVRGTGVKLGWHGTPRTSAIMSSSWYRKIMWAAWTRFWCPAGPDLVKFINSFLASAGDVFALLGSSLIPKKLEIYVVVELSFMDRTAIESICFARDCSMLD